MFASMRRYRLRRGSMEELTRRVDDGFADEIWVQPGFVCYELIDCGEGEIVTISVFDEPHQAQAARVLARRWTQENLTDLEFKRIEVLRGPVMVSRARQEILWPAHVTMNQKFGSVRRYQLRCGAVDDLMRVVDEKFADQIERLDGFEGYHAVDCGHGQILSISLFEDQQATEESDERALQFVRKHLAAFDIERTDILGGEVAVSRAQADLLLPTHA
jgi:hypothetical protein